MISKLITCIVIWAGLVSGVFAQSDAVESPIGFNTVEQAYKALEADPTADLTTYGGWEVFNQKGDGTYFLWSFTPEDHPANPTVVRREIMKKEGQVYIRMDALCQSNKPDCDQLMAEFEKINEGIKQKMSDG